MSESELEKLRGIYHDRICADILGVRLDRDGLVKSDKAGNTVYNIADGDSLDSVALAAGVVEVLERPLCPKPPSPQAAGTLFTTHTLAFLQDALGLLGHLIPGEVFLEMRPSLALIAKFDQYEHLDELERLADANEELAAVLGRDYIVVPDIVIGRSPLDEAAINQYRFVVGQGVASLTPARGSNGRRPTLKASVSCKWTMRSDRAQNTRTEANNLIRNRKGSTPHIAAVTMEPLPSRLESIALGIGDIDCAYHGALYELEDAAEMLGGGEVGRLQRLVKSRRLRDISDLPLDLVG